MTNRPLRGYFLTVAAGHRVAARISANDVPVMFLAETMEAGTLVSPINHFLVPGRNTLSIEVTALGETDWVTADVRLDHTVVLAAYKTPRPADRGAVPPPYRAELFFEAEGVPPPPYLGAPRAEFDARGTPGQHAVVAAMHAALARGDADGLFALQPHKAAALRAVYGPLPKLADDHVRQNLRLSFAERCEAAPFPDDLVFDRCHDGRIACARRAGGEFALTAVTSGGDPFFTNVYLLHRGDDRWAVIW